MSSFSSFSFLNQSHSSDMSTWPDSFITTSPSDKASNNIDESNKQEHHSDSDDDVSDHDVEFVRRGLCTMYKYI